jgi:hypothetical protein
MERCNSRRVFPINKCGRYGSRNQNNHEPPTHLGLCLICCYAAKTSSSRSSTCICDQESRSPEPSSWAILHRERANKVFRKQSLQLLARFISSSPRLIYLFVDHASRVIAFNAKFIRPITVFIRSSLSRNHKSRTVPPLKSCLTYLIC